MKNPLSKWALAFVSGLMLWCCCFFYPRYLEPSGNSTFGWDAGGYYWYLPSIFIYHDLGDQAWADSVLRKYDFGPKGREGQGFRAANGNVVMKYSCGMALMEAPFFFIGHGIAKITGYPQDGFSRPYRASVQIGALLVAILGLWGLRRFLLEYFRDAIVAATLLVLVVGTNYLNYSTTDNTIAHSWLFTIYVFLLLATRAFFRKFSTSLAASIGLLCGLATLVRPTDIIACLIPLLWGLESLRRPAVRAHFRRLWLYRAKLLVAFICATLVVSIQLIYWKVISGEWIVYSYEDQGFSFLRPHILNYTFSYRSGWVTYTPVVLLALLGIVPVLRNGHNRVMTFVFLGLAFYLVTAWDIWWYGGTGGRAMVQYYPLLCVFMAAGLEWMLARAPRALVGVPVILMLAYVNVWFMYQAHAGGLYDAEGGMTRAYYWRVVGRITAPPETVRLRDGKDLYEGPTPADARLVYSHSLHLLTHDGRDSLVTMNKQTQRSVGYVFPKPDVGYRWLRASARFNSVKGESAGWKMLQFTLATSKAGDVRYATMSRVQRWIAPGETKRLPVDLRLPRADSYDSLIVHFWNAESDAVTMVDSLEVRAW